VPFTLAHPVAVWPLRRLRSQLVPLIIGSIAPDLPDYMPAALANHFSLTHHASGVLRNDMPLGLLALVAVVVLRGPLTELAGPRTGPLFRDALERFARTPHSWLAAPLSVFIGICSHLLWDSITHEDTWLVLRVPWLATPVTVLGHTAELAHLLQYLSSVAGVGLLLLWYRSCVSALPVPRAQAPGRRGQVLAGVVAAALIIGVGEALGPAQGQTMYRIAFLLLTRTMAWFALLYLVAGIVMSLRSRSQKASRMTEGQAPGS
jgi:hypothetical protein